MNAPADPIRPGVRRRAKADVPFTPKPISVFRRPPRDRATYMLTAREAGFKEAEDRKHLANRLKSK
jgi:hypothetical protein